MRLVLRDKAIDGAETFVFTAPRGTASVRVRKVGADVKVEHGEAVGGRGTDDELELMREACACAIELVR